MSLFLADILNESISDNNTSYLELGCYIKANFNKVKFNNKECVDTQHRFFPTYVMTTDDFFKQNKKKYDIVFIDANHDLPDVVRDYNNAVNICNKMIVFHDMFPPNEEQTASGYCSDSYKLLNYFKENKIETFTLNTDFGLTVIFPSFPHVNYDDIKQISYQQLLDADIKTYTKTEIVNIVKIKI
jgi:hypothetical protein